MPSAAEQRVGADVVSSQRVSVAVVSGVAAAVATFFLAFEQGAYSTSVWGTAAIVVWGGVLLAVALSRAHVTRLGVAAVATLAAFAAFTGLSGLWGSSAETAYLELDRGLLYAGVLCLALVLPVRPTRPALDGVATGLSAIAATALAVRFFPSLTSGAGSTLVPGAEARLSYPVGYWNALGVLVTLALPLLARIATDPTRGRWRAVALAPVPAIVTVDYLASSRSAFVTLAVAGAVFVVLSGRWPAAAGALIVSVAGGAAAAAFASGHDAVISTATGASVSSGRGHLGALGVVVACAAVPVAYAGADRLFTGRRLPRGSGRAVLLVIAALLVVGLAVSHPVRRVQHFTAAPAAPRGTGYIQRHLLSTNGNYRWQYWRSTLDELETAPLSGRGAGSFESWWDQHGSVSVFVANPHSLYFETLGDLGAIGIVLLGVGLLAALALGVLSAVRAPSSLRPEASAAAAVFAAFLVAAGIDWMWDVPAIGIVAFALLGLTAASRAPARTRPGRARLAVAGFAAVALLATLDLVAAKALVSSSQASAARGDLGRAAADAHAASVLEPWASSPRLQLALVREAQHRLADARSAVESAVSRDRRDWRVWYIKARIENEAGRPAAARASYAVARRLSPGAPLLKATSPPGSGSSAG